MNQRRSFLMLAAIVAAAACSDSTSAIISGFYANLSPDQERPAIGTGGTGTAVFTVVGPATSRTPGDSLSYTITATGLTSNWNLAHIHTAPQDSSGPVRLNLCGTGAPAPACPTGTGGTVSGRATTTGAISFDSLYVLMKIGRAYVNFHTTNNGGGETRGEVLIKPL